jgi:ubiquinol oxidase
MSTVVHPGPPGLDHDDLLAAQAETLGSSRRRYGLAARALFAMMDLVYGTTRTLSKFKVLELIARVPYQSWEQVAYIAVTHIHARVQLVQRIQDRVNETRAQQDNEQWHLLVLEELIADSEVDEGRIRYGVIPQIVAFAYYQLSWALYVVRPAWSYALNADFEDHAEHEYMHYVVEHPELEDQPFAPVIAKKYGTFASQADLFRQIAHDERVHKEESLAAMAEPRFR